MNPVPLSKDQLLSLYQRMLLIRRCEEQLARRISAGLIHGACHTYVGQEAIAVGVCAICGLRTRSSARIAGMATPWPRGCRPCSSSRSFMAGPSAARMAAAAACTCSLRKSA